MRPTEKKSPHLLIFEPRVEGHHLTYLRYITEDFLHAGCRLTLALNGEADAPPKIRQTMGTLLDSVSVITLGHGKAKLPKLKALEECQKQANADLVFLTSLDEIASSLFRKAAFGIFPSLALKGRIGGIYFRPRMLMENSWSPNQQLKKIGLMKMLRQHWFHQILFCDEFLHAEWQTKKPNAPFHFLPDPFPNDFLCDSGAARRDLELPAGKKVFLFYGGPYRRKGLYIAVEAMRQIPPTSPIFLLCAGQQPDDADTTAKLNQLVKEGRARVLARYISDEEEKKCFAAADAVLLPYLQHFGSSGVLARAGGAGKPVIASDEELIGRRVRTHGLGLIFPSGNVSELKQRMEQFATMSDAEINALQASVTRFGYTCTRQKFGEALVQSCFSKPTTP